MSKPWLASYPSGVPAEIDSNRYRSLAHLAEESFAKFAARTAYVQMDKSLSFGELDRQSRAFGAWLQQRAGLKRGDRVAIMMPNVLQYPIALFGVLRAGGTVVNTNPLYTARELRHQLVDSKSASREKTSLNRVLSKSNSDCSQLTYVSFRR